MYSSARIIPSKTQRWGAAISCCVLVGLAIGTLPYASRPAPVEAAFLPIFVTLAAMSELFTAFLLLLQFRAAGYVPLALLAIAYTTTGTIIIAQACSFPGVMSEHGLFGARPQTAVWLWAAWHGGFPALVILYALGRKGRSVRMEPKPIVVAGVWLAGITLGLGAASVAYLAPLPTLVSGSDYSAGFHGPWQVVIALSLLSIFATLAFTRLASALDLWLTVALVGALCDVTLTIWGGARFSTGWYLARVYAVFTSLTVSTMFVLELSGLYMRFAQLAYLDALTGLGNRRTFDERLDEGMRAASRESKPLSLLMLDVDDFKRYNDLYGHVAGDDALRQVAAVVRAAANRPRDTVARYGGEEFAIVLPDSGLEGATTVAEHICAEFARRKIPHDANRAAPYLTVSVGIAVVHQRRADRRTLIERAVSSTRVEPADTSMRIEPADARALIARADAALYVAKTTGRNRVAADPARAGVA